MAKRLWFWTKWPDKMEKAMVVAGFSEDTREAYDRAMRQLVEHCEMKADLIEEEDL